MKIYRTLPSLSKRRELTLWHKALKVQWSAADFDWDRPGGIRSEATRTRLGRVLSPILMGEQAGMYSITRIVQVLGQDMDTESQFFLLTMAVDEAKHTELLGRYYARLEREPLSIRKLPASYLFQSEIMSDDPVVWLTGSLVSEVLAKLSLEEVRRHDYDPVLSEMCDRILEDEVRHLGFNRVFLEGRFAELRSQDERSAERSAEQAAERLTAQLERVLELVPPILDALAADNEELGVDADLLFERLRAETRKRLSRSIQAPSRQAVVEGS